MQFSKAILSTLFVAMPMTAFASEGSDEGLLARAPVFGDDIDSLVHELVSLSETHDSPVTLRARSELEARAGWTCSFLAGNKGCQIKCFLLSGSGGYCNGKNICSCY